MASGYSQEWSKKYSSYLTGYVRVKYSTSFNATTRKSTVTITPQFKASANYGTDYRLYSNGLSGAGLYGNGTNLYALGSSYSSGNYAKCGSATNSWADFNVSKTFTVQHGDDGKASFTLGVYGAIYVMYDGKKISPIGAKSGNTITITEAKKTYAVTYNANGGSGAPSAQTKTYGTALTLSSTIPVRSGYNFLGWATSSSATTPQYQPGDSYTINAALSLFAVWEMAGSVHIDDGTSFSLYTIRIDNGESFDQYVPYIDDGTSWHVYS